MIAVEDRNQAREMAKDGLEWLLQEDGIDTSKAFRCVNPNHKDNSPSMRFSRKYRRVKCFGCGESYDTFDYIAIKYNLTNQSEIFEKAYQILGIGVDNVQRVKPQVGNIPFTGNNRRERITQDTEKQHDFRSYYEACKKRITNTDYTRGLSPETLRHFDIGFDPAWRHPKAPKMRKSPRLIIPTSPYSYLARHASTEDYINYRGEKENKSKVGRIHIFNFGAITDSARPTFIVEGEIDAASIYEAGGSALALGSTAYCNLFLKELDKLTATSGKPEQPIIIALDNDTAGKECAEYLKAELQRRGLISYRQNICGEYKDVNEMLMKDRNALFAEVKRAETAYKVTG